MNRDKVLLGGIGAAFVVGIAIVAFSQAGNETVVVPEVKEEVTELELLTEEIMQSEDFKRESHLRAEARAMYELSTATQQEAVELSEKALETYREAMKMENAWKVNQTATSSSL